MIPVQLTLKGLYSYQKAQTIDFTKLTDANLFGIFGSVGSGKSSILEAITFAVYGKTDRFNLSGDNRNYNMMNLKSDELLIDFTFETGKAQTAFRALVQGKRNSKRFDDVKKLDRSAYQRINNEWVPIETVELEKAIGLSYANFKRTIIIPQGQFQEFLQLGNKERTLMMKELFNLEKFELFYKVTALESKNNARKQNLEGQLQQLGEIDVEQVKAYEAQLVQLKKEIEEQALKSVQLQKQERECKDLQTLTDKLLASGKTLKHMQAQQPAFAKLEQTIVNYEQCVIQFKHLLESIQSSTKRLKQKEIQIQKDSEKLKTENLEIARVEKMLAAIKPAYDKREDLKQQADELGRMIKIKDLGTKIKTDKERLKKGTVVLNTTSDEVQKLNTSKNEIEVLLKTEKTKLPDMAALANIKAWHVENKNIDRQAQENEKQVQKYLAEQRNTKQTIHKLFEEEIFAAFSDGEDLQAGILFLRAKVEEIKKELKALEKEADELRLNVRLQAFADGLHEGKSCPLCGSVHHPEVYSAKNSNEAQHKLQKGKEEKEKGIDRINELVTQLNELNNICKINERYLNEWSTKKVELEAIKKAHSVLFKWNKYKDVTELEKAFSDADLAQNSIKKKETELENKAIKLEKAGKNKERFQAEIVKIETALTVSQTELKTLQKQLTIVDADKYKDKTVAEIGSEQKTLLQKYMQLEKQFNEETEQLTQKSKNKNTLEGSLKANTKELEQETETMQGIVKLLDEEFAKSNFKTLDDVKQILAQPIVLAQEKQKLADFKEQLLLIKKELQLLQTEIGERAYSPEAHKLVLAEIEKLNELSKHKNQELGKLNELLKKLQKDLANQAVLRKELNTVNLRAENIKTMKSLFKGSGFVNYISTVYLQNLCNAANDRFFQLTRQKLSLEITPDNNFQVRDFMNGGRVRSVKTLSGGQTFQAALSLALALADNIQKITESNQNFFFLDEGFGSLDKDSLSVVFDTLKSLRTENRIVGVISHVEEMQQEIDVHLRIENHEENGSLVHASWRE